MSIDVRCKCGKAFRAKEELAGKTVRCPGCHSPLPIPGAPARARSAAPPAAKPREAAPKGKPSPEALLRLEEAEQKRRLDAEAEAAQRDEMNKLVNAWDQMAGKGTPDGKGKPAEKKEKIGEKASKVTAVTRLQDGVGVLKSTLIWKYIVLVVLLIGGGAGSVYFFGRVVTTGKEMVKPENYTVADIPRLFNEARAELSAGRLEECRRRLDAILRVQSHRKNNLEFVEIEEKLNKALAARRGT